MERGAWSVGVVGGEVGEEHGRVLLWDEDAGGGKVEGGFEGEERGAVGGEDLVAVGVDGGGGGGEEDEPIEGCGEICQDGAEVARVGLDSDDDGYGFGGPGGDLGGVRQAEW